MSSSSSAIIQTQFGTSWLKCKGNWKEGRAKTCALRRNEVLRGWRCGKREKEDDETGPAGGLRA
eukprot:446485-Rhodomonas_salina.1